MKQSRKAKLTLLIACIALLAPLGAQPDTHMYFCTAANNKFFPHVVNLIGSIHKSNFDKLGQIMVFDLGMNETQKTYLSSLAKTTVRSIEMVHPDLLRSFATRSGGKPVPGWYAWKPVAIKQALEAYPHVLWIDAGTTVLRNLRPLFDHIREHGYFFHNGSDIPVYKQLTNYLINKFDLKSKNNNWILGQLTRGIEAGLQGYTRKMWEHMIMPMYELSKDLRNFADDGTAPGGFGNARHDTSLYSVVVNLKKLYIHQHGHSIHAPIPLMVDHKAVPFHVTFDKRALTSETYIYISRHALNLNVYKQSLRKK